MPGRHQHYPRATDGLADAHSIAGAYRLAHSSTDTVAHSGAHSGTHPVTHVRRELNRDADRLANRALDEKASRLE